MNYSLKESPLIEGQVALVTFISHNYGTCLQAFALKRAIETMGGKVFIPNIKRLTPQKNKFFRYLKTFTTYLCHPRRLFLRWHNRVLISQLKTKNRERFALFQRECLHLSDTIYTTAEELNVFDSSSDAVVCGSDMIWSPEFHNYLDIYLLTWVTPRKRIAYAPSFGSLDISTELVSTYHSGFSGITFLSCREKTGCEYIESLVGKEVPLVCDPTLLFSAEEWLDIFPLSNSSECTVPPLLVNCFGELPNIIRNQLEELANETQCNLRYLHMGVEELLHESEFTESGYGPIEFIHLFAQARFIVVNGYHGLLFAIIFRKPFVLFHRGADDHWREHEQRMMDLLSDLGLESRYLYYGDSISSDMLTLNYHPIEEILQQKIEQSWKYLYDSLYSVCNQTNPIR